MIWNYAALWKRRVQHWEQCTAGCSLEATSADDATLVLGQFSPLVDKRSRQGAGPLGRDRSGGTLVRASPSPARDTWQGTLGKGHLQGTLGKGHQWQWDGLPQNIPPLLLCSPLHNQSFGCTGGEIKNRESQLLKCFNKPWNDNGSGGSSQKAGQTKEEFASCASSSPSPPPSSPSTSASSKAAQTWQPLKWQSTS